MIGIELVRDRATKEPAAAAAALCALYGVHCLACKEECIYGNFSPDSFQHPCSY